MKTNSGMVLLGLVLVLALLTTLGLASVKLTQTSIASGANVLHSDIASDSVRSLLLAKLSSLHRSGSSLNCTQQSAKHGRVAVAEKLCARVDRGSASISLVDGSSLRDPQAFPQIDFNTELARAQTCTSRSPNPTSTPSGFTLTPTASVSRWLCTMLPPQRGRISAALGNVYLSGPVSVDANVSEVAITGYFEAADTLRLSQSVVLLAGGDIHLKRVDAVAAQIELTLVSGTGSVVVDEILGSPKVSALAWQGVYLPPETRVGSTSIFPQRRKLQILGFYETELSVMRAE